MGNLPTPRPSAEQCNGKILCQDGQDVTQEFQTGARIALQIAQLVHCKIAVLKSKSPTCGCGIIYDGTFSGKLIVGDGIFCALLQKNNIQVYTEDNMTLTL
ncbi:DUF523 domain-containing protein [Propionispora sp. 2/2-37]|uniref:DUF523 domain-containing protein n=1 Tax=Propionispora sp. 2/2-37 TaxID=1677858 RepID=UPI000AAB8564|nr:DUF523 domain-containing protein [Propionispora sp. 2/2-37]